MPEPLDYYRPEPAYLPVTARPDAQAGIPIDFDFLLIRTNDHAAARTVEAGLNRGKIDFFRSESPELANREILLFVRSSDQESAAIVVGTALAQRADLKSLSQQHVRTRSVGDDDAAKKVAQSVTPREFDSLLVQTKDRAEASAIETQLSHENISFVRSETAERSDRKILLYVRAADYQRSIQVANVIWKRRVRLKSFPRQKTDPPEIPRGDSTPGFFIG